MFSFGRPSNNKSMFTDKVSEADVLGFYLGITSIPCLIPSPFRSETRPSLAFYSPNGKDVNYIDFGDTTNRGTSITFLMKLWNLDYNSTIDKIVREVVKGNKVEITNSSNTRIQNIRKVTIHDTKKLECKIREWRDYDIEYWESFGVPLSWLKWAEVYPVEYKIIIIDGFKMVFKADKYCYTFVERKEGRITHKFYQPFNQNGYKWQNSHDKSVIGLWTKLPERGKAVCICSSMKDALCLMSNLNIHCIYLQAEGYPISKTALNILKQRFTDIYVLLDNDEPGRKDAEKLCSENNLINVVIPPFEGGKDVSDYFKIFGKEKFIETFKELIIDARNNWYNELPF